ncbi:hypothetical protein BOTBODRAFT_36750 [Botryobasidium botryosum FD-172 SS1]|uniref:Uncharacterized protein n=1 Tax=Botryobasidium botryosum (strain FD-172 SS1) TaxID=930990 RepID=A0A067M5G3_BOTB1|nr:hypothetical protein BOTBODRAFT_36750 [Botryobasidium botryosum FD-172 SS1]
MNRHNFSYATSTVPSTPTMPTVSFNDAPVFPSSPLSHADSTFGAFQYSQALPAFQQQPSLPAVRVKDMDHDALFNSGNHIYISLYHKNMILKNENAMLQATEERLHQSLQAFASQPAPAPPMNTTTSTNSCPVPTINYASLPKLEHAQFPKIHYWTFAQWAAHVKAEEERTQLQSNSNTVKHSGRSGRTQGENITMRYIEQENGQPWTNVDKEADKYYISEMYSSFPELRYCDDNWKAQKVAFQTYPGWIKQFKIKDEPLDVDSITDLDTPPKCAASPTASQPPSKKTKHGRKPATKPIKSIASIAAVAPQPLLPPVVFSSTPPTPSTDSLSLPPAPELSPPTTPRNVLVPLSQVNLDLDLDDDISPLPSPRLSSSGASSSSPASKENPTPTLASVVVAANNILPSSTNRKTPTPDTTATVPTPLAITSIVTNMATTNTPAMVNGTSNFANIVIDDPLADTYSPDAIPLPPRLALENVATSTTAAASSTVVSTKPHATSSSTKPCVGSKGLMVPVATGRGSTTPRNLYAWDYCKEHPDTTKEEFTKVWDNLATPERKKYTDLSKAAKKDK